MWGGGGGGGDEGLSINSSFLYVYSGLSRMPDMIPTLNTSIHSVAQTRELVCTNIVLPHVIDRGKYFERNKVLKYVTRSEKTYHLAQFFFLVVIATIKNCFQLRLK